MAKPRHDEQPTSSNTTMAILVAGGVLVAALVVWALTRTVEPASTVDTMTPATDAGSLATGTVSTAATSTFPNPAMMASPAQPQGETASVTRIAAEDLRAKLNRGEVTVIDVRDAAAFTREHIPGAMNIPFATVEAQIDTIPKGKAIVTYCTWPAEETSAGAALILQNKGITNVTALYGGLGAWTNLGYATEKQ